MVVVNVLLGREERELLLMCKCLYFCFWDGVCGAGKRIRKNRGAGCNHVHRFSPHNVPKI